MTINCLDLFAGGGGLSEGFINAGYSMISHIEMDKDACLTLKTRLSYHYLKSINKLFIYEDYVKGEIARETLYKSIPDNILNSVICKEMNSVNREEIFNLIDSKLKTNTIDLIIGGPPCQAYSLIGRNKNIKNNDKRKYLYLEYLEYVKKYQPRFYIFENVKGILTAKDEFGNLIIKNLKSEFEKINYTFNYSIFNSVNFNVPQKRERVFIVGWKSNEHFYLPHFEIQKPTYNVNQLFKDLPKLQNGENQLTFDYSIDECVAKEIRNNEWKILTQHNSRNNNTLDKSIYEFVLNRFKDGSKVLYNQLPEIMQIHTNKSVFVDRFKVINGEEFSHTIMAHLSKDGHYYIHPDSSQNRSITVREAARLQSFPDSYYFESNRTSAFKQIGNAVPPNMSYIIATKLKDQFI